LSRQVPRQVGTAAEQASKAPNDPIEVGTGDDRQRQGPTSHTDDRHDVARLEREVERLQDDRDFLREQIKVKDKQIGVKDEQIASMLQREHETNVLIQGLQQILTPRGTAPRYTPTS
jgi:hypothetical protein